AEAQAVEAAGRYHQAVLRYNALTGRGPKEAVIFEDLNPEDVDAFFEVLRKNLKRTDRLSRIIGSLRNKMDVPQTSFPNLMDWVPIFESITFFFGVQLQDTLSDQALGVGVSL